MVSRISLAETQRGHRGRSRKSAGDKGCHWHCLWDPNFDEKLCLGKTKKGERCKNRRPVGHKYCRHHNHDHHSGSEVVDNTWRRGQGRKRCNSAVPLRTDGKRRCLRHFTQDRDPRLLALLRRQVGELESQRDSQPGSFSSFLAQSRLKYLNQLMGLDAMAITSQQKIDILVRMMINGEVLTNFDTLSPSLLMRDLQQRLAAEFPDLGHISLVVGQKCVSGGETIADLANEAQLMESSTPQMTVYVIKRPRPVLHANNQSTPSFGCWCDTRNHYEGWEFCQSDFCEWPYCCHEVEEHEWDELDRIEWRRVMTKEEVVYSRLHEASILARSIAEAAQIHLDNRVCSNSYYELHNAIVISNPLKDAPKETCLEALGIVQRYCRNAEVSTWQIVEDLARTEAHKMTRTEEDLGPVYDTTSIHLTLPIPLLRLMLEKLSCHFLFRIRRPYAPKQRRNGHGGGDGCSDVSPIILGGFDVEGSIIGVLGIEGGDGAPYRGW